MIDKKSYEDGLSLLKTAMLYLNITTAVFEKTVESGNIWFVVGNSVIELDEYKDKTQYSDFNIMVPSLFNLYHGVELLLKGFLYMTDIKEKSYNHNIEKLYTSFQDYYPEQTEIIQIIGKYIDTKNSVEPLRSFFINNGISSNAYYEALRYPFNKKKTKSFNYNELIHKGTFAIPFFKNSVDDISDLRQAVVELGRSLNSVSN